jgi:hypothetical protein
MGERGSLVPSLCSFESHGRLEVEEAREYSSWEEEEKVKVKAREPLERTLLSRLSDKGSRLH